MRTYPRSMRAKEGDQVLLVLHVGKHRDAHILLSQHLLHDDLVAVAQGVALGLARVKGCRGAVE